ncbi:low molecular weight protein-tyrosine-phosphatase [Telluria sp. B2]
MKNILVICIGNICRSPMAEALLRRALPGTTIRSAGLQAMIGHPADPFAVQLMAEQGLDITSHRAQQISSQLVRDADLILTMDREQKKAVESRYVESKGKVYRLGEFGQYDIADPYREGIDSFRAAYRLIDDGVNLFAQRLGQMA